MASTTTAALLANAASATTDVEGGAGITKAAELGVPISLRALREALPAFTSSRMPAALLITSANQTYENPYWSGNSSPLTSLCEKFLERLASHFVDVE